jgi:hypothetical protein
MFSHSLLKSLWLLMAVLLIISGNSLPFPILAIFSYATLLAPLVREFSRHSDLDERQLQISHYSSHIAYLVFLILLALIFIKEWMIKGQAVETVWFILLSLPVASKVIICVYQNYGSAKGIHGFLDLFFRGVVPQKTLDERQDIIGNFSSHIALYLYTAILLSYILFRFILSHEHPGNIWYMLLIVPVLIKLYVSLLKNYGAGTGARSICFIITGIILLFVVLSHGAGIETIIEASPFLLFLIITMLSFRFPRTAGFIFLCLGIGSLVVFRGWQNFEIYLRILMYSFLPLPLILSGWALLKIKTVTEVDE